MIPKSLHTVTALVRVATQFDSVPADVAVGKALRVLGYAGIADPYGLAVKAIAVLTRERTQS